MQIGGNCLVLSVPTHQSLFFFFFLFMFSSDRLLVTWSIVPDLNPALSTRFALIKTDCELSSVRISMHLLYEVTCPCAGYTTFELEECPLVTSEAAHVAPQFCIHHILDGSSPLLKWWCDQHNSNAPYKAPLLIVTVVGIDLHMQAEVSATKVPGG